MQLQGCIVATVTPFADDKVDLAALEQLIELYIASEISAIVVGGSTGEAGTLLEDEAEFLLRESIALSRGRIPIIAATAHNYTKHCIVRTKKAQDLGAQASLITTPSYIKPMQHGLIQHYTSIAEALPDFPIILYNVPARTGCDLLPAAVSELSYFDNIIGIKDASGQPQRLQELLSVCADRISVYAGDDSEAKTWILNGAKGVISVAANILPKEMVALCRAAISQDMNLANHLDSKLAKIYKILALERNPIPVKFAAAELGLIKNELRPALTPLSAQYHAELRGVLVELGLI
jgi:4-hydroxy-tetrahydrodipicolinate synthase